MKKVSIGVLALASILVLTSSCRRATPAASPAPKSDAKATTQKPAVTYADFSRFDLSTPQKATVSFVELYNGIMPVTPLTDIQNICSKSAAESYQADCIKLLDSRLQFLKGIARNLQDAHFSYQPLAQANEKATQFKAIWKEKFTFFDGTTQSNDKRMTITLQQSKGEWRITQAAAE